MESSSNFFFNTSQGSINPAFKKLEKNKLVTTREKVENGRLKKIFSITEKGEAAFLEWMNQEVPIPKIKGEILLRMFFFSKIDGSERAQLLEQYISVMGKNLANLKKRMEYQEKNNGDEFESDTLKFGIDVYGFIYTWFEDYVVKLRQKEC